MKQSALSPRVCAAWLGALSMLFGAFATGPGCKKKEEQVQYPPEPPKVFVPPPSDAAPADSAAAPGDAGSAGDGGAQALDMITQQTIEDAIKTRAKKDARGMKPLGDFFGSVVQEGGQVEQTIMIEPKRCYAVVAIGSAGVSELDIQIQARAGLPMPLPGPVIAVDSHTGPAAAVSPCWKNPFPVGFPAAVVLKATRGGGPLGGRVYVK